MQVKQAVAAAAAALSLMAVGFWAGHAAASGNTPGSAGDPLVSKSYVEELIHDLQNGWKSQIAGLAEKTYVDQKIAQVSQQTGSNVADKAYVDQRMAFEVVNLPAGHRIIGSAGTEIVLRGGKAIAIASQQGGLLDVTAGTDIFQGISIPANHLLAVPRDDGRGLFATADAILMVKGGYTIITPGQ